MTDNRSAARAAMATEAADWYARLRAPDVSEIEAVRFRAWLAGDPARRREFDAVDSFWQDLSAIEHSPEVMRVQQSIAARPRNKGKRGHWTMAAALAMAVGGAAIAWHQWSADRYVTNIGEQRMVPLADGSIVTLNTATEIRMHYSAGARKVELVRGQANFDVAKDPSRPFIVAAGGGHVRALGTVFDVYKSAEKVTVTLIEGKVAVTPNQSITSDEPAVGSIKTEGLSAEIKHTLSTAAPSVPSAEIIMAAGEQLTFETSAKKPQKNPDVLKLASADVPRATAWRNRKLDFSNTPLLEAIAEANRYSREQIVLAAPELVHARISGTFEAGKNEAFVEGLQTYFRLQVERSSDHQLILTRQPD